MSTVLHSKKIDAKTATVSEMCGERLYGYQYTGVNTAWFQLHVQYTYANVQSFIRRSCGTVTISTLVSTATRDRRLLRTAPMFEKASHPTLDWRVYHIF